VAQLQHAAFNRNNKQHRSAIAGDSNYKKSGVVLVNKLFLKQSEDRIVTQNFLQ
jgi:hypothetical protein